METEKRQQLQAYANAIAEILYEETDSEQLKTLEGIEKTVRSQINEYINPEVGNFLSKKVVEQKRAESEESRVL